jgi:hypothetical protein
LFAIMMLGLAIVLWAPTTSMRNSATGTVIVGDSSVETGNDSSPAGEAEAFKTAPATAGTIDSLSLYLTTNTTATSVLLGLYSDAGGRPGTLLTSGKITAITKNAWNSVAVPAKTLTATSYWIALSGQGGAVAYRDRAGLGGTLPAQSAAGSVTALPASWQTGSYVATADGPLSAYGGNSGATATPTPSPSPAPIAINNAACTVTLSGTQRSGSCTGTFTPGGTSPTPTATAAATPTATATATAAPTPTATPAPTATPTGATLYMTPTGSDSNNCTSAAPCASMARAYAVARTSGDVVSIGSGSYGDQTLSGGSKSITFRGTTGNKIRSLSNQASNITLDGLNLDADGATQLTLDTGGDNVTVKNSRIGNVVDEKGAIIGGNNVTIDNVYFHDVVLRTLGIHNECAYVIQAEGIHLRNSTFTNCATMDVMLTYGFYWTPLPPLWGNGTIENNKFYHPRMENASEWHYFGLLWHGQMQDAHGWVVRNNWFETTNPGQPGRNEISETLPWIDGSQKAIRCGNTQSTAGVLDPVWTAPC